MSLDITENKISLQDQVEETEQFFLYRFTHKLGVGLKGRMKSLGCQWNAMYHGWLGPITKKEEMQLLIRDAGLEHETKIVTFPKGMIPSDPKVARKQSRLEILEESTHAEGMQLLKDVVKYDDLLRPEDFDLPLEENGKTPFQLKIEKDFQERRHTLTKKKDEIEYLRKELLHLKNDSGEKVLDHEAPLSIADAFIQQLFSSQENRTLQYCSETFWKWNGIQYIELNETEIRQSIYSFLRDAKERTKEGHLENFNPTKYKVDQVIDALKALCFSSHHPANGSVWLDGRNDPDPKYLLPFKNGLLNIKCFLKDPSTPLIPHTPLLMNTNSLTFDFVPDAQVPIAWHEFLNTLWPNDIASQETLQEWIGYLLTQDTSLHKILLIVGPPRSGKGTIGRILRDLLGHSNVVGPTLSSLGGEFGLQPLLNKTMALIADARLNNKGSNNIIIERLLSVSGEDPLTINRKFLQPLTVQLPTRIMVMTNELPDMRDSSGALAKRYLILTLKKSWLGKEDTTLLSRLQSELPAILLWALEGLLRLQTRGRFIQPESSSEIIEELIALTSPIKSFIADTCEINSSASVSIALLFDTYCKWCEETGYTKAGNIQSFGKNLRAAFPEIEIYRPQDGQERERRYRGIRLASVSHSSADVHGRNWNEDNNYYDNTSR